MSKRTPVLIALALLVTAVDSAQAQQRRTFFGVVGGATLTDFGSSSASTRWGGTVGIISGVRAANWSVVNIEVTWTQRGAQGTRLDYIDVPLLIGASGSAGQGGAMRGRLYTGIGVGFKIKCAAETSLACADAKGSHWFLPVGLQLGRWSPDGTFVGLDIRYDWGLSDAFNFTTAYNRGFQFRVLFGRAQ